MLKKATLLFSFILISLVIVFIVGQENARLRNQFCKEKGYDNFYFRGGAEISSKPKASCMKTIDSDTYFQEVSCKTLPAKDFCIMGERKWKN